MFWVYIIYSDFWDRYYVGSTDNIERRIREHNSGKGNFTSKGMPWKQVITISLKTRSEAMKLELKIKKRGIKRYLQDNNFE
jgi:putative endonuclease